MFMNGFVVIVKNVFCVFALHGQKLHRTLSTVCF